MNTYMNGRPVPQEPEPTVEKDPYADLKDFVDSLQEEWLAEEPELPAQGLPCVARLVRLGYYIARRVDENFERFGLTRGEFEVLAVLVRNPEADITPKILQTKILITSGVSATASSALKRRDLSSDCPTPTTDAA